MYREIVPPERVVFTEIFEPFPDAESVVTAVLTEENGKTRLTVTCCYPSVDVRDMVLKSEWNGAPASATTGSKSWSRSCSGLSLLTDRRFATQSFARVRGSPSR